MNDDPDLKGIRHDASPQSTNLEQTQVVTPTPLPPATVFSPSSYSPANTDTNNISPTPTVTHQQPAFMQANPDALGSKQPVFSSATMSGQKVQVLSMIAVVILNLLFLLLAIVYGLGKFLSQNPRNDGVSYTGLIVLACVSIAVLEFAVYKGMIFSNIRSSKKWDLVFKIAGGLGVILFIVVLVTPFINK